MALKPSVTYPGQTATNAAYPYGAAQNQTVDGDGTGTPWESQLVNDLFGLQQCLLVQGRVVPSGSPDAVGASDYISALFRMFQPLQVLSWDQATQISVDVLPYDPVQAGRVAISPNLFGLLTDKLVASGDGGLTWAPVSLTGTGVLFLTVAADTVSDKAIATGSKATATDIQHTTGVGTIASPGTWSSTTPPGSPISLTCSLFDPNNQRFIVIGKTASAPYIATCELADLTTWTQRTVPASITGSQDGLSLVRFGTTIVATWGSQTKTAFSTDGGVTWTASTTSVTSGSYLAEVGDFGFVLIDSVSTKVYNGSDGITWTALANMTRVGGGAIDRYGYKFLGGVFILRPHTSNDFFYYSVDQGNSWQRVYEFNRSWSNFGILRGRLLVFSFITVGPDADVYLQRSAIATFLPATG